MSRTVRTFTHSRAVRSQVPLLIGLAGPSGGGKTYSALRLATGIQSVTGGKIFGIDTESGRMQHYATKFEFEHVPFSPPFNPLSYLAAIRHCYENGAKVILIDSASHEHEGQGGVLEMHEAEVERLSGGDWQKAERVKMLAWGRPKSERRALLNSLLQIPCHFIFCFRAKEKLKIVRGQDPIPLGYMPIAGEEFVFEMTVNALLLPGAGGVPEWNPTEVGERSMIRLPEQFRDLLLNHKGPLDESLGEKMARWAAGEKHPIETAETMEKLVAIWNAMSKSEKTQYQAIKDRRKAELETAGK